LRLGRPAATDHGRRVWTRQSGRLCRQPDPGREGKPPPTRQNCPPERARELRTGRILAPGPNGGRCHDRGKKEYQHPGQAEVEECLNYRRAVVEEVLASRREHRECSYPQRQAKYYRQDHCTGDSHEFFACFLADRFSHRDRQHSSSPRTRQQDENSPEARRQISRGKQALVDQHTGVHGLSCTRREHETEYSIDNQQRTDRAQRKYPDQRVVVSWRHVITVEDVKMNGQTFDDKKHPLDSPEPVELVDENRNRPRARQGDTEPYPHAAYPTEHIRHEQHVEGVPANSPT